MRTYGAKPTAARRRRYSFDRPIQSDPTFESEHPIPASLTAGSKRRGTNVARKADHRRGLRAGGQRLARILPPDAAVLKERRHPIGSAGSKQRSASVIVEIAEPEAGSSSTAGPGHNWSRAALACHVSRGPRRQRGSWVNASITAADAHDSGEALDDVFGQLSGSQRATRLHLCRFRRQRLERGPPVPRREDDQERQLGDRQELGPASHAE